MAADYYSTLGISKSATADEIKKAYRKQALAWHPDKHTGDKTEAERKFKEINEAYQVLSNPQKKQIYDAGGNPNGAQGNPFSGGSPFTYTYSTGGGQNPFGDRVTNPFGDYGDPFDIFAQFFGGGMGGQRRAKPRYSLRIEFMEAIKGVTKIVEIDNKKRTLKIPAGVNTGNTIDFGDFSVSIEVGRDKRFERENDDIIVSIRIPFSLAALGGEIEAPSVWGDIKIKIRAGTEAGTMMRLREQGAPRLSGRGKGDEYVKINIETASRLTRKQRELIEELRDEGL